MSITIRRGFERNPEDCPPVDKTRHYGELKRIGVTEPALSRLCEDDWLLYYTRMYSNEISAAEMILRVWGERPTEVFQEMLLKINKIGLADPAPSK